MRRREYRPRRKPEGLRLFTALLALLCGWILAVVPFLATPVSLYHPSPEIVAMIRENAKRFHLSEEELMAVMLTESRYDPTAVSETGAQGLMQLMPETAAWISEKSGLPATDLRKPEENIPLGAWYWAYLLETYKGNRVLALAAYNAGHGNVDAWMTEYKWANDFDDADAIPFPETREFVKQVLKNYDDLRRGW